MDRGWGCRTEYRGQIYAAHAGRPYTVSSVAPRSAVDTGRCVAALTIALSWAAAFAYNPQVSHYLRDAWGPAMGTVCGEGGVLRLAFGLQRSGLQYVPCGAGALWFLWYWKQHGDGWNWRESLPFLLIASILCSPYFWFYDFILALPAFISLAARGAYRSIPVLAAWQAVQTAIVVAPGRSLGEVAGSLLWIGFWWLADRAVQKNQPPVLCSIAIA